MKTEFKLTYTPFWNILKWIGFFLVFFLLLGEILYELKYDREIEDINSLYITMSIFFSILFIPSIIITYLYYKENKKVFFVIDNKSNIVEITKNGITKSYSVSEIERSTYHRQSYQKDWFWNDFSCYSDLGYIDLIFKNNDRYYLTCFLVDVTKEPIFKNSTIKHSFLPVIKRKDPRIVEENNRKELEKLKWKRIEKLRIKLAEKSEYELNEILNSKGEYTNEAIDVAKEIIKNKNVE